MTSERASRASPGKVYALLIGQRPQMCLASLNGIDIEDKLFLHNRETMVRQLLKTHKKIKQSNLNTYTGVYTFVGRRSPLAFALTLFPVPPRRKGLEGCEPPIPFFPSPDPKLYVA